MSFSNSIPTFSSKDYYGVLGVSPQATREDIAKAFRALIRRHHPDTQQEDDGFARELIAAYKVLSDDEKRRQYDLWLHQTRPASFNFVGFPQNQYYTMFLGWPLGWFITQALQQIAWQVIQQNVMQEFVLAELARKRLAKLARKKTPRHDLQFWNQIKIRPGHIKLLLGILTIVWLVTVLDLIMLLFWGL